MQKIPMIFCVIENKKIIENIFNVNKTIPGSLYSRWNLQQIAMIWKFLACVMHLIIIPQFVLLAVLFAFTFFFRSDCCCCRVNTNWNFIWCQQHRQQQFLMAYRFTYLHYFGFCFFSVIRWIEPQKTSYAIQSDHVYLNQLNWMH